MEPGLSVGQPAWNRYVLPGSRLESTGDGWRFVNEPVSGRYTDSQIDDYQGLRRRDFIWRPPLTLTVRARFSSDIRGTAGFGFWNDPFMMTGSRLPMLPRALWFFYASEESDMALALGTPGNGFKAATIDALRLPFFLLAPASPIAIPLMNIPSVYNSVWPIGQRAIAVNEAPIQADMTQWHVYTLRWDHAAARFAVDGQTVMACTTPPHGPLGFVMWIDNQAMVVSPKGRIGWRTLDLHAAQWMEATDLSIRAENQAPELAFPS